MEEPHHQTFKIGLLLSKLNQSMSEAEAIESCKIYFKIASINKIDNLLILELDNKEKEQKQKKAEENTDSLNKTKIWLDRLALTKEAHIIIGKVYPKPELNPDIKPDSPFIANLTKNRLTPSFKISSRNVNISEGKDETITLECFAGLLAEKGFHKTNMHSPDLEFTILNASKALLGIKIWTSTDLFEKRKAHLRPILHPTAINPRIARAMINLAGAEKEIFDPFCGVGGILLEGARIYLKSTGTDIDSSMIKRATINLSNEGQEHSSLITLIEMDALKWNKQIECIVTDLPYGKSSKLATSLAQLACDFLTHYCNLTDRIVVCFPKGTEFSIPSCWMVKYTFNIYIHKSLTREILVLEKNKNKNEEITK